jgi:hypothetical protein
MLIIITSRLCDSRIVSWDFMNKTITMVTTDTGLPKGGTRV